MNILLTNDDGLGAEGLVALENALSADHKVWIVAPDREMSGRSHGITLSEGLKVTRHTDQHFAVRGTPVDCVNLGVQVLFPELPDICISGINRGPNLGTDIIYSGTCAAAREAVFRGVPAVAASFAAFSAPWDYEAAASFLASNLDNFLEMSDMDRFINVNWPPGVGTSPAIEITRPGKRRYRDEMVQYNSPRGGEYWFMQPASIESSDEPGTDTRSIHDGRVSVSCISIEPGLAPNTSIHDTMKWRGR